MSRCFVSALRSGVAATFVIGSLAGLTGCGGGKVKINAAKLQAVRKVAVVGVCTTDTFYGLAGIQTSIRAPWGSAIVPYEAAGVDSALATAWRGVELLPLSTVAARADLPKGAGDPDRVCSDGIDPFAKKGKPNTVLMKQMADALQVDAVLAVWSAPALRSGASKARVTGGTATAFVVDGSGEVIVTANLNGVESAEVENVFGVGAVARTVRDLSPAEYQLIGTSLGQALGTRLGAALTGG
jgi:hypothetical protein